MTNQKLLELAAKAAGIPGTYQPQYFCGDGPNDHGIYVEETGWLWNPLTDEGDAFRLAIKLGFIVAVDERLKIVGVHSSRGRGNYDELERFGNDRYAAARLAIVRAAAAKIGKAAP